MDQFVKAAQVGDTVSWNVLYKHHYPWLYTTALRIVGNSPKAKDAVQETFISAYLHLKQVKDAAAFGGWLKTILLRYCIRGADDKTSYAGNNYFPFEQSCNWEDEINRKLDVYGQQLRLYTALACLSDTLQSVLLLRYFSEWHSYEHIASILCVPVGTVRSRLNQAKQKITEYWRQNDEDDDLAFRRAQEWNDVYKSYFSGLHSTLSCREKFIMHLDKNLQFVFTSGKIAYGRHVIEKEIEEDLVYGSSFGHVQVTSSGNLSIVEAQNINSAEYPDRCPESSVLVLYRSKLIVTRMNLHNSR